MNTWDDGNLYLGCFCLLVCLFVFWFICLFLYLLVYLLVCWFICLLYIFFDPSVFFTSVFCLFVVVLVHSVVFLQVNLRYGMSYENTEKTTCTACAGTLLLEFAALSRLTGNPEFEVRAHKAMEVKLNLIICCYYYIST